MGVEIIDNLGSTLIQTGERHKLNGEGYEGTPTVNLKNSLKKSVTIELDQFEKPLHFGG